MSNPKIRDVKVDDIPFLIDVINSSNLFPGEMLRDMIGDSLGDPSSEHHWITYETDRPIAVAYYAPEKMTSGTWNLYLIAVHSDNQGTGIGSELIKYVEGDLRSKGERLLIVETSDLDEFALTRKFYEGLNFQKEAHIREFYQEGEGKIVFTKRLNEA